MKNALAAAAATAAAVTSSLIAIVPPPQAVAPALILFSIPHSTFAEERPTLQKAPEGEFPIVLPPQPIFPPETVKTAPPEPEEPAHAPEAMKALIKAYAAKYGVNAGIMEFVVSCETGGTFDPKIQSFATYDRDRPEYGVRQGDRELSFGLAQIHLPANPNVTLEQATDPDFALDFLARGLAAAEFWRWSCL